MGVAIVLLIAVKSARSRPNSKGMLLSNGEPRGQAVSLASWVRLLPTERGLYGHDFLAQVHDHSPHGSHTVNRLL
jgi:hypothetical protein